jgi:DNA-binding Lrp family transcriptional regulator
MIKLTDLDKKILFELDKDGRANYSEIARSIGTTPQVVKYHFERLRDYKAIKNFWAFVDYDRAGYSFFWAYWFKFSGISKEKLEEIFASFKKNKYIPIVFRCEGWADAMICITTKNVFSHNEEVNKILKDWGQYITMSEMNVGLGFQQFPRTYLLDKDNTERISYLSGGTKETAKINETERKIMSILQINGRTEFTEIAKILGISAGMAHSAYKSLLNKKIINKTAFTFNHEAIGIKLFRIIFKIAQYDQERIEEFHDFCLINKNITNYVPVMGNWQLFLDIEIENHKELRELLREIKFRFKEVIIQAEVNEIYNIEKFSQMVIEYPEVIPNSLPLHGQSI